MVSRKSYFRNISTPPHHRKHFPYEDYDEWLFGGTGLWNGRDRHPEILVIETGLHTCVHAWRSSTLQNVTMIAQHKRDLKTLMKAVRTAVDRTPAHMPRTTVIVELAGRFGGTDPVVDRCSRTMNRVAAYEGHLQGFAVYEREEVERRLLFKSEHLQDVGAAYIKPKMHLDSPAANIAGTALIALIGCLKRNGSDYNLHYRAGDV
jgi:hypothetical protein